MKISGFVKVVDSDGKKRSYEGDYSVDEKREYKKVSGEGELRFCNLNVSKIKFDGEINGVNLSANDVKINGSVIVDNIVATESVIVNFSSRSKIKSVKCQKLQMIPETGHDTSVISNFVKSIFDKDINIKEEDNFMKMNEIKASDVKLSKCSVDIIYCDIANLSDCKVKKLYYTKECICDKNSIVDEKIKIRGGVHSEVSNSSVLFAFG